MRDLIMGFYQTELIKTNLDLIDLVILKYIADANAKNSMTHFEDDDKTHYVWLAHSKFHEDLPFIKMAESTLKARLSNLKKDGWLKSVIKRYQGGSITFYTTTEKYKTLLYTSENVDDDFTRMKNNTCASTENNTCEKVGNTDNFTGTENNTCARIKNSTCAGIKNNTPYNKLIDNKLKKDIISKDIISVENSTKNISDDTKDNSFGNPKDDNAIVKRKGRRERVVDISVEKEKPKRRNRYEQFMDVIDEYTEDEKLRELLREYARVRLEKSKEDGDDKTFYASKFKSIIKHLDELSDDIEVQYKIVQQSIDRRYRILCALSNNDYNSRNNRQNMIRRGIQMQQADAKSFKDSKEKAEFEKKLTEDAIREGRRVAF